MKVKASQFFLALYFLFPLLSLLFFFKPDLRLNFEELLWALKNSFIQSFFAAVLSIIFGLFGALGIRGAHLPYQRALKFLALVPAFLPSLFSVMIAFSLVNPFPMGTLGVIVVFILIYAGFAASILSEEMEQIGKLGFVAETYNFSKLRFFTRVLIPFLSPSLFFIFLTIFISVMTSFTVPLLIGGGRGTNLEVLIFEKIFVEQNWSIAIGLALIQVILIFLLSMLLRKNSVHATTVELKSSRLLSSKFGLSLLIIYLVGYFLSYLKLAWNAVDIYYFQEIFNEQLLNAGLQSIIFFMLAWVVFFLLLATTLSIQYHFANLNFLNFFINPSSVLVGFSFYLLFPHNSLGFDFLKLTLVLSIVVFVGYFKSLFQGQMQTFASQINVARSFNISYYVFLFHIFLPQIKKKYHYATSLLFVYCISEFGLIKASGSEIKTLGTEMASYLSSYRVEGAFILSLLILALWFFVTWIVGGVFGVHKKSQI
jgi:thiamine transport system permease protein